MTTLQHRSRPFPATGAMLPAGTSPSDAYSELLEPWRVAWTRGGQRRAVAEILGDESATPVGSDLRRSCIEGGIDLLIARRLISFDLVPLAVPLGVELEEVRLVTAAVAGGPHSELAAAVAARLAGRLGVPATVATVYRSAGDRSLARHRLEAMSARYPSLAPEPIQGDGAEALTRILDDGTLLVLGAPGGSWLHRQLIGAGRHLALAAPGGALVVRNAPRRCFHRASNPVGHVAGPQLGIPDALLLFPYPTIPVVENGRLVGTARRSALANAHPEVTIGHVMEPPIWADATASEAIVGELALLLEGGPIPVADRNGRLVGTILPDAQ